MTRRIVLFDGICNLCNASVQFIIRHDSSVRFHFAALQSDYAKRVLSENGLNPDGLESILLSKEGKVYFRSDAALEIARELDGLWPLLYAFRIIPPFIRDMVYNGIARNRYRWFGKRDACMIPTPELRDRFIG